MALSPRALCSPLSDTPPFHGPLSSTWDGAGEGQEASRPPLSNLGAGCSAASWLLLLDNGDTLCPLSSVWSLWPQFLDTQVPRVTERTGTQSWGDMELQFSRSVLHVHVFALCEGGGSHMGSFKVRLCPVSAVSGETPSPR